MEKDIDQKPSVDLGYHNNFLSCLEKIGIEQIYEPGHISGKHNSQFIEVMGESRSTIKSKIRDKLRMHGPLDEDDIVKLVNESDTFVLYAKGQGWFNGEVENVWRAYKRAYINDVLPQQEKNLVPNIQPVKMPPLGLYIFTSAAAIILAIAAGFYTVISRVDNKIDDTTENLESQLEATVNIVDHRFNNRFEEEKKKLVKEFWEIHYPKIKNDQRDDQLQYLTNFVENTPLPPKWKEELKKTISEAVDQMWEQKKKELFGGD